MSANEELPQLLERIRAGDETALAVLLQRYEPRLRTAARILLGPQLRPHLDTLDLVQSVHRMLLPGLRAGQYDFADPEALVALALTALRRKVANNWRKRRPNEMLAAEPAGGDDPAEEAELRDDVAHWLSRVNEDDRQLLEMRLEGLGAVDIAQRLGSTAGIVRARLSRIRQKLREAGGPEWV